MARSSMLRAVDSINGEKKMKLNMKDNNTIFIRMTMTTTTTMTLEKQHQRRGLWREETERGSKQEEEDEDEDDDDDLMVSKLGEDIVMKIMEKLDARSLARSLLVSRSWFSLASSDSLWSPLCKQLWIGKAHIPRWSKVPGLSKLACFSRAVIDSKRTRIMRDDLWDHSWEFHFTEAAPDYWKNLDPYWGGVGPPMHRYFHPDGSQTADPEDKVWGGHECAYTIVTGYADGKVRRNYVRINRWPHLNVSRRDDWGWEMSNVIFAYSSVPDADKEGGTGPLF
ncbi:hypothetical protein BVRB_009570 isoform A [Beta vulgaris subsp. vulgaris]|uniref:F-box domain-containing protein n=1 Tax=Beta vulgaris subsp. vulgaris TaxID=3555 RepID=A0A0J8B676_BETVV|nr:hypothetical protein BVRB_009570 isoform A [Beta vulgaris subsp. vulgaris]